MLDRVFEDASRHAPNRHSFSKTAPTAARTHARRAFCRLSISVDLGGHDPASGRTARLGHNGNPVNYDVGPLTPGNSELPTNMRVEGI
jgi:hypothetical protein